MNKLLNNIFNLERTVNTSNSSGTYNLLINHVFLNSTSSYIYRLMTYTKRKVQHIANVKKSCD